ncbi:MAG: UbiA family prenyltransferase [Candidatus Taylorbacteria bacterium]
MLDRYKQFLSSIEISPLGWLVGLSGILCVRFFLESFSSPSSSGIIASDAPTLLHYYLFFLVVALIMMFILGWAVPSWKKVIPTMTLFALLITIVPPIIDWLTTRGKGVSMAYLFDIPRDMMHSFFTFFGPFTAQGITLGIRIELALILIGIGYFVYAVCKQVLPALLTVVIIYIVAFVTVSLPGILFMLGHGSSVASTPMQYIGSVVLQSSTVTNNIHGTLEYGSIQRMVEIGFDFLMSKIWFVVLSLLTIGWFIQNYRRETLSILKNYRPERLSHFIGMVVIGMIVAYQMSHFSMNWNDWMSLVVLVIAYYFSWMSAVCVNDVYDIDIDAISNKDRPITGESISPSYMKTAGILFFIGALIGGYLAGYYAFFCVLTFNALYYIYSAPPLRLKIIPFLATGIIGLCSVTAVIAGFFTFYPDKEIASIPYALIMSVVVMFSLLPNVRDIKDIAGDTAAGIKTVPTLFGPLWGPRVTGILAGLGYVFTPLITKNYFLLWGAIPALVLTYFICVRKPYTERPVFIVYGLFALFVALVLL